MKTTEIIEYSPLPADEQTRQQIDKILTELRQTLLTRTDGVSIVIARDSQFPPLVPGYPPLMTGIKIRMWDISA